VWECGDDEAGRDSKDVKGSGDINLSASSKDNEGSEGSAKKA
jgi:hypothetical protein